MTDYRDAKDAKEIAAAKAKVDAKAKLEVKSKDDESAREANLDGRDSRFTPDVQPVGRPSSIDAKAEAASVAAENKAADVEYPTNADGSPSASDPTYQAWLDVQSAHGHPYTGGGDNADPNPGTNPGPGPVQPEAPFVPETDENEFTNDKSSDRFDRDLPYDKSEDPFKVPVKPSKK